MQYLFREETQGLNAALIYVVTPADELDTMSVEMLARNNVPGLVPLSSSSMDGTISLRYNVTGLKKLSSVFAGTVSRNLLLGVILSICDVYETMASYMLDENTLLLEPDKIYFQPQTERVQLVCLPLANINGQPSLHDFLKQIIFTTRFDQSEDCSYVAQIINYLNGTGSFTAHELRAMVKRLIAAPAYAAPRPAVPVPPAAPHPAAPVPPAKPAAPSPAAPVPSVQPAVPSPTVSVPPVRPAVPSPTVSVPPVRPITTVQPTAGGFAPPVPGAPGFAVPGTPAAPKGEMSPKERKKWEKEQEKLEKQHAKEEKAAMRAAEKSEKGLFGLFGKKKPEPEVPEVLPGTPSGMPVPGVSRPNYAPVVGRKAHITQENAAYNCGAPSGQAQSLAVPHPVQPVMPMAGGAGYCTVTILVPNAAPMADVQASPDGTKFSDDDDTMLQTESDATELAGGEQTARRAWIRCRATGEATIVSKCLFVLGRYGEPKHRADGSLEYPADCTVRTADRGISRRHAAILYYAGRFYLADISSRHETYLNGLLTEHEDHAQLDMIPITFTRAYPLKNGDIIRLRSEEFQFEEG